MIGTCPPLGLCECRARLDCDSTRTFEAAELRRRVSEPAEGGLVDWVHIVEEKGAKPLGMVVKDMVQEAVVKGSLNKIISAKRSVLFVVQIPHHDYLQILEVSDCIKEMGMLLYILSVKPHLEMPKICGVLEDGVVNQIHLIITHEYDKSDFPEVPGKFWCIFLVNLKLLGVQTIHLY